VALVIAIDLLTGSYEAAAVGDREQGEWPPHPARVFSALRAAARGEQDLAALRWLEQQPPPVVVVAELVAEHRRQAWVVTNRVEAKGGSLTHPGRANRLRSRVSVLPAHPNVRMVWPVAADADQVAAMDRMARRIPYLGRSTGVALLAASASAAAKLVVPEGNVAFEPCDLSDGEVSMRVPYPGYLAALEAQFKADRSAWEVSKSRAYRRCAPSDQAGDAPAGQELVTPSVYADILIFRFSSMRPQAQLSVRLTESLRSAVLRACDGNAPEALHGHDAPGRPHVAFLALPDVGREHADGHLLGLAVAVPELPRPERAAVVGAVLGLCGTGRDGAVALRVPRLGRVELMYAPGHVRPWGASQQRWRRGSRRWVSATPMVLDRHPKRPATVADEIRRCLRTVGLPEPVDVQVSVDPLLPGAARLRPSDLPEQSRGKLFRHVDVTFERQVSGPVLVGAGRYLGVGLLAPVTQDGRHV
jgi:CRISPR-associated protein Csb2